VGAYPGNAKADIVLFLQYTRILFSLSKTRPSSSPTEPPLKPDVHQGRAGVTTKPEITHPLDDILKAHLGYFVHYSDLPVVTIHRSGPHQEHLRQAGAMAMTHQQDIYIREEYYNEGSHLTDLILLHELTHVKQFTARQKLKSKAEREAAEEEATAAEQELEKGDYSYSSDPVERVTSRGQVVEIKRSERNRLMWATVEGIMEGINEAEYTMGREEYLKFLCNLKEYGRSMKRIYTGGREGNELEYALEDALKERLNHEFR
jgi:hypothetical protein